MFFFCPHFFFSQQGKIRFYFVAKNLPVKVLLLNILSKQLQTFSFTQRSFTEYCQLLQTISSSPSKYCFALYCDTFKKLPKVTLKNPPFRSVHIDLTFAQLFFSRPKSLRQINTKRKKKPTPTKVFATFLEGSTIAFLFLFKRRSVFYDGMKSEANEMTNGRNI